MSDSLKLDGKIIFVNGANGLIGSSICDYLSRNGATVLRSDLKKPNCYKNANISEDNFYQCDISDEYSVVETFKLIDQRYKNLNVVINCAAATGEFLSKEGATFTNFEDSELKVWNTTLNINLTGSYLVAREASKIISRSNNQGSIINFSSIYGLVGPDHRVYDGLNFNSMISYASSKGGVLGLTRWLSSYLAKYKVRVNCVVPGGVENNQDPLFINRYCDRTPLGRMARPSDFHGIIHYLCSDSSSYATGQIFVVDGGLTAI